MFCPTCQAVVRSSSGLCPVCGGTMREVAAGDAVEVVETTAEIRAQGTGQAGAAPLTETATLTVAMRPAKVAPLVPVRLAELSMVAWRQPLVRTAVKTGAGALALSLAMRVTRQAFLRPAARRAMRRSVPSALKSWLESDSPAESEPGATVIETVVYMRRVVRR